MITKNKKGFTVIEVIVTFVLVMIIVVGLLKIAMSYRNRAQIESIKSDLLTYKSVLTKDIMDDILKIGLTSMSSCSGQCVQLNFQNGTNKQLIVGTVNPTSYDSVKNKYIKYGTMKYKLVDHLPSDIPSGELPVNYQSIYIPIETPLKVTVVGGKTIYSINIKIEHVDLTEDYGIHIVTTVG